MSRRAVLAGGVAGAVGAVGSSLASGRAAASPVRPGGVAAGPAGGGYGDRGQAPPEWARNAGGWPSHNYDLANTRATTRTAISARTVSRLRPQWRFPLSGGSPFGGAFSSNPLVLDGTVFLQDINSTVFALDQRTGQPRWQRTFDVISSAGPNGIAVGWGLVFGATPFDAFALDARTGAVVWQRRLVHSDNEGIDVAPQIFDDTVVLSTVPGNNNGFYTGGARGVVWALDPRTGEPKWHFDTVPEDLWGNPEVNSGGGLWYPPAVDRRGRVFCSVGNPAPFPGTPELPNGASRPGPNLYTNSLVTLDGRTGRLLWYRQVLPHDIRDYDLQVSAVLSTVRIRGVRTDIVVVAGKMGKVYTFAADDGRPLWTLSVGRHQNDVGPLPEEFVDVFPGVLGGVETPMALAGGLVFVPWVDLAVSANSVRLAGESLDITTGRGGLTAVDAATGAVVWENALPQMPVGAATVANDVVFTSIFTGEIYAFSARDGRLLWTDTARAGINGFPAVAGDMLFVGAGAAGFSASPTPELTAYQLR